jgi:hypothetical protein
MMVFIGRREAFLILSVCCCIYCVELWKNEGPSPARNFS